MSTQLLWLLLWLAPAQSPEGTGTINGTAVNATHGAAPLVDAVVVLRANLDGGLAPIDETRTDSEGRFSFRGLPLGEELIYLPGVNHDDVHYPGPRLRLNADRPAARVRILAYDAVESPSPLVCRRAEIDVRPGAGYLEITETLLIANPANVAYVGESLDDRPPVTLRLSLPSGFDKVTFDKEFHGRSFVLHNSDLLSDLPWPPGERQVRFRYRLPAENRYCAVQRGLDLPTDKVIVRVWDKAADQVACSLAAAPVQVGAALVFEQSGDGFTAGQMIELQLGALPMTPDAYIRWGATAVLVVLIVGAAAVTWRRRRPSTALASNAGATPRNTRRRADIIPVDGATPRDMPRPSDARPRRRAA
jgi:hypothetical protein